LDVIRERAQDWIDRGQPDAAAFSCVGRWPLDGEKVGDAFRPCNYAGGGLF